MPLNLDTLPEQFASLAHKRVMLGFDGFIDHLVRVKAGTDASDTPLFLRKKEELVTYLQSRADRNFTLELDLITTKLGGNMPIMAQALAKLGVGVDCIGTLGMPEVLSIFQTLPLGSRQYSFAEPGTATALEFEDGKVILAEMKALELADWSTICAHIGLETMQDLAREASLIALLNWSELPGSTAIWRGILEDVLPNVYSSGKEMCVFADLSDCSRRSTDEIREILGVLAAFGDRGRVVLGLNRNEAQLVLSSLGIEASPEISLADIGFALAENLRIDTLLLHQATEAVVIREGIFTQKHHFHQPHPVISTGAGDNFNAGFCLGLLLDESIENCLTLGHAVAASYVGAGASPDPVILQDFLENRANSIPYPPMNLHIFVDYEAMSRFAAIEIIETLRQNPKAAICLASGDTPLEAYRIAAHLAEEVEDLDLTQATFIGLDEWVGISPDNHGNCAYQVRKNFLEPLQISASQIHFFDGMASNLQAECDRMDAVIADAGGLDLIVVGVGVNGHIGLNEPGSDPALHCRVTELAETTRTVGQKYFANETHLTQGITLGLGHFMEARKAIIVANGERKAAIIQQVVEGPVNREVPASIVRQHPNGWVLLDEAAAEDLSQRS